MKLTGNIMREYLSMMLTSFIFGMVALIAEAPFFRACITRGLLPVEKRVHTYICKMLQHWHENNTCTSLTSVSQVWTTCGAIVAGNPKTRWKFGQIQRFCTQWIQCSVIVALAQGWYRTHAHVLQLDDVLGSWTCFRFVRFPCKNAITTVYLQITPYSI